MCGRVLETLNELSMMVCRLFETGWVGGTGEKEWGLEWAGLVGGEERGWRLDSAD